MKPTSTQIRNRIILWLAGITYMIVPIFIGMNKYNEAYRIGGENISFTQNYWVPAGAKVFTKLSDWENAAGNRDYWEHIETGLERYREIFTEENDHIVLLMPSYARYGVKLGKGIFWCDIRTDINFPLYTTATKWTYRGYGTLQVELRRSTYTIWSATLLESITVGGYLWILLMVLTVIFIYYVLPPPRKVEKTAT